MPVDPCVSFSGVRVALGGRPVLDGLSLTASPGRVTALLGPNGAGKTTTVRCCTGMLTPDAGTLRVLGGRPGAPTYVAACT